uniref:Uncharacterized protein n=1 Tax=Salix viminalis TaxID=40686 RepID=A0A6N2LP06_SALVM
MSKSWFFDKDFSGVPDNFFEYALGCVDFPMEDVETNDDDGEDWESKFRHLEPPPSNLLTTFSTGLCAEDASSLEPNNSSCSVLLDGSSQLKQCPSSAEASSSRSKPILSRSSDSKYSHHFQATSPVSVLESAGSSCSTENATAYYPKFVAQPWAKTLAMLGVRSDQAASFQYRPAVSLPLFHSCTPLSQKVRMRKQRTGDPYGSNDVSTMAPEH